MKSYNTKPILTSSPVISTSYHKMIHPNLFSSSTEQNDEKTNFSRLLTPLTHPYTLSRSFNPVSPFRKRRRALSTGFHCNLDIHEGHAPHAAHGRDLPYRSCRRARVKGEQRKRACVSRACTRVNGPPEPRILRLGNPTYTRLRGANSVAGATVKGISQCVV